MSVNGSNVFYPNTSFTSSGDSFYCYVTQPYPLIFITYSITSLVFLSPVFLLVLFLGLQQWWQQRSASADGTLTNLDVFALHLAVIELFGIFGSILVSIGIFKMDLTLVAVGLWPFNFTWYGETYFHVLTCLECYLAVVYPIRYQSLRRGRRITIRNVSIACSWLISIVQMVTSVSEILVMMDVVLYVLNFLIAIYCSVAVLYILRKKLRREQSGNKDQVCQRKLRAYYIMLAMLVMLLLTFAINIIWTCTQPSSETESMCMTAIYQTWLSLPTRLALPVRFLHRPGVFSFFKNDE